MQTPQKYRRKTIFTRREMPREVLAMKLQRKTPDDMDVYRWVENGTEGSFDVNSSGSPIPHSGVSLLAGNGKMVIASAGQLLTCEHTDYVVLEENGNFSPVSVELFESTYEIVGGE